MSTIGLQLRFDSEADLEELAEATSRLRRHLTQLDVDTEHRVDNAPAPAGTRAVDVAAVGELLVMVSQTVEGLLAVVGAIGAWLGGRRDRSVRLELDGDVLELTGISSRQQDELIDIWVTRHAPA